MKLIPGRIAEPSEDIAKIVAHLVRARGLSEGDLLRVVSLQRSQELRLTEALMQLGLATQADIDAALSARGHTAEEARGSPSPELTLVRDPFHPLSEQVRALRTEVLLRQPNRDYSRVAIVSPSAGDGRSRLAAELAVACAQLDQPTLLVDADLRKPRQQQLFNLPAGAGLSDTLAKGVSPRILGVQGLPQLSVLVAGESLNNPMELLTSRPFADLLESWQRRYRHVVLDTAAVERGSDALAVALAAGVVLPMARLNATPLPAFREILQRLRGSQASVLGGVLNSG